ncbi:undecaprenyl-phosphate glucose phosphotransferase [Polaromonas sp. CG_9.11]|uniref:undecaprenyl-phosphate glucose phosphotransferase n=1 Tax=Polaromonas sp. CG_9.11 TaxID=2787730 RepID=UPI001A257937|nr:undecaprenyl-phosphate glucose phosphotransferase [Polaromonas sp. CG_9.11]MBG6076057.1 putative colanic acid biosynthesis UDP-glucose lipid carrier transferase [Polaromonas sp. CG_9.11]
MIESALDPFILILSLWVLAFNFEGAIKPPYLILSVVVFSLTFPGASRLRLSVERMIFNILFHWFWIAGLLLLVGFATDYLFRFPIALIINWLWIAPAAQIAGNLTLRATTSKLLKMQGPAQRAVIVGMNNQGVSLAENIGYSSYLGMEMLGFFDDRSEVRRHEQAKYKLLGKIDELANFVKKYRIQYIYLSLPMIARPRVLQILDDLKDTTASIYFVPDMFITDLIQGRSDTVCGVNVISVCDTPFRGFNGILKRASDIILSVIILMLVSPIMILIAIMVKLGSPGPAIFKQRRYGLDGEQILVYKFRSMAVVEDGGTIHQAKKNDQRITRIGSFLRRTSLDELPQFFNVLQGRMSIVGPRPHAVAHNEMYRTLIKGYMVRHKVRPGITGWAQVNGYRGETDTLDKMQARIDYDLDYLRNWSLQLDLFIVLKTVRLVFKDGAAY